MISTVDGTNSGLSLSEFESLVEGYVNANPGVAYRVFDLSELTDLSTITDCLFENSLFCKKELIVLKRPLSLKKAELEVVLENILKTSKDIFIWSDQCIPKNTNLYKKLAAKGAFTRVEEPSKRDLNGWVLANAKKEGVSLEPDAVTELIESQGADPALILKELEKLGLIGKPLSKSDITVFGSKHHSYEIWSLIRDIESSNKSSAMQSFKNLIDTNVDPMFIFNMIAREYRLLYQVKLLESAGKSSKEIVSETKLHPFVVSNLQKATVSIVRIAKIYEKLLNIDYQVKQSLIDPETALAILLKIL